MLEEIRATCSPSLIADGSKPFQAVLTKYEPDHIEAEVTCHFSVPPGSAAFVTLRQSVLLAIAKAMETNKAEFALPSINYKVDDTAGRDLFYNDSAWTLTLALLNLAGEVVMRSSLLEPCFPFSGTIVHRKRPMGLGCRVYPSCWCRKQD
jgi:hypothetical protein